jgi:hypothetical protein
MTYQQVKHWAAKATTMDAIIFGTGRALIFFFFAMAFIGLVSAAWQLGW